MVQTLAQRVLKRAMEKLGSLERLAAALGIPGAALRAYLEGRRAVPDEVLTRAADMVADELAALRRTDPTDDPEALRGR